MMGTVALVLLIVAEMLLGTELFGRSMHGQVQAMTTGPGLLGLLGQLFFAAFPLVHARRRRQRGRP